MMYAREYATNEAHDQENIMDYYFWTKDKREDEARLPNLAAAKMYCAHLAVIWGCKVSFVNETQDVKSGAPVYSM